MPWICASHSETSTEIPQIAICSVLSDFIKNGKFASNYIKKGDFTGSKTSLEFKVLFTYFLGKILIWLDLVEKTDYWLILLDIVINQFTKTQFGCNSWYHLNNLKVSLNYNWAWRLKTFIVDVWVFFLQFFAVDLLLWRELLEEGLLRFDIAWRDWGVIVLFIYPLEAFTGSEWPIEFIVWNIISFNQYFLEHEFWLFVIGFFSELKLVRIFLSSSIKAIVCFCISLWVNWLNLLGKKVFFWLFVPKFLQDRVWNCFCVVLHCISTDGTEDSVQKKILSSYAKDSDLVFSLF